jgi:hypothetical protein
MMRHAIRLSAVLALVVLGTSACSSGPAATASEIRVTNATDAFQFSVLSLAGRTDVLTYTWQNTGPRAQIDVNPAITSGGALLTVRDADGIVLYQEEVRDGIDTLTAAGTPGAWGVEIDFGDTYGSFAFSLTKQN